MNNRKTSSALTAGLGVLASALLYIQMGPLDAGIDRTGAPRAQAFGRIASFGSVVVNGVRYDTSNAQFIIDGVVGSQSDLSVGDVVAVQGSIDATTVAGTANVVIFDDLVEGPISAVDLSTNTVWVLGQAVRLSEETLFDASIGSAADLTIGQRIEVSGLARAGDIEATRVARSSSTGLEVTSVVANLDDTSKRFHLASQVVDYSGAELINFPNGDIVEGDRVEVRGTSLGSNGEMLASTVELKGSVIGGSAG